MDIIVSIDNPEGEQFVDWLRRQGHDAEVGNDTGNYIDGVWTDTNEEKADQMNQLWDEYCNQ